MENSNYWLVTSSQGKMAIDLDEIHWTELYSTTAWVENLIL